MNIGGGVAADFSSTDFSDWRRPKSSRVRVSARQPTAREPAEQDFDLDADWGNADDGWEDLAGGGGDNVASSTLPGRAANIPNTWADVEAHQAQQKWESIRPSMQESYVQSVPARTRLNQQRLTSFVELLAFEVQRRVQHPCCSQCGRHDMQLDSPVDVLFICTDVRFKMSIPRFKCAGPCCSGGFTLCPFSLGFFPCCVCVC